ncbi:STAS domain-containing protein [Planctomycetales bacterium ZRK34]|nr:STAS domain-containing protein [Planctomycetales bacterium ZRK34]
MTLQVWSEDILLAELADEPGFSEELAAVDHRLETGPPRHVVLNLVEVHHINSSNISQLLRLRQRLIRADRRLRLACVPDNVWGVLLTTGLDKVFEFSSDVPTALAAMQLNE